MDKEEKKFLVSLGKAISVRRKALKISQVELAKKVGIARSHVYRIEMGQSPTSIITYKRIAKILGVELAEIMKV